MSVDVGDIHETFEQYDLFELSSKQAKKCVEICNKYELSADSLAMKCELELVSLKRDSLTFADLQALEKKVMAKWNERQSKYARRSGGGTAGFRRRRSVGKASLGGAAMNVDSLAEADALSQALNVRVAGAQDTFTTPIKHAGAKRRKIESSLDFKSPSILASPPSASFQNRPNIGKVVQTYNKALAASPDGVKQTVSVPFEALNAGDGARFRYMFEQPDEKSELLNSSVARSMRRLEAEAPAKFGCADDQGDFEFSAVNFPSQTSTHIAGRVVCEAEGQLNAKSVLLEGDRAISAGNSIKLDIGQLDAYALFPGQVVALEGINSSGQCFVATKLAQPSAPKPRALSAQDVRNATRFLKNRPTSVMVAAGPYTTTDNMQYWPLNALLDTVEKKRPDVLVLAGPFVDCRHKDVILGNLKTTFEEHYAGVIHTVAQKLAPFGTRIVVLPSPDDAHHLPVFPQPPARAPGDMPNVEFLPNPATFTINDVTFGVVGTDVLKHLSKQEISRRAKGDKTSRLVRLASHLLSQNSYYPLFPPAKGAKVDYRNSDRFQMHCRPDVLITPGDLQYCASKSVGGTSVCVNPGRLSKGTAGGTYAMVSIHPTPQDKQDAGDCEVVNRIRVDIVRI